MRSFNPEIIIKYEIRPCIFKDSMPALFHRWFELNTDVFALLEFEDGHIEKCNSKDIRFTDGLFGQIAIRRGENENGESNSISY